MSCKHELKTDSAVFDAVWSGEKTYEIRFNDKNFVVGDILILRETVYTGKEMRLGKPLDYTGRETTVTVSHILKGPVYGLADGWVIMSFTNEKLAAANARIAELEQQQFAGQTWVTFDEHMKALKKIKQMEDAIKFDFERFMEFQQRAEQAEAKAKQLIKKLTYNTPSFRDGKCDEELLTIDENELVPLKSCMCDRLKQAEARIIGLEKELSDCKKMEDMAYQLRESLREEIASANARISSYEQRFGEYCKRAKSDMDYWKQRAEQAEAQCAAYKKALDIAMSTNQSHETYCKVEAALEEKLQWRSNDK